MKPEKNLSHGKPVWGYWTILNKKSTWYGIFRDLLWLLCGNELLKDKRIRMSVKKLLLYVHQIRDDCDYDLDDWGRGIKKRSGSKHILKAEKWCEEKRRIKVASWFGDSVWEWWNHLQRWKKHLGKSCFHDKNQQFCVGYDKSELFYNQVEALKQMSLEPLHWISSPRE